MSYKVNINVISVIKINRPIRDNVTFAINFRAMMMVTVALFVTVDYLLSDHCYWTVSYNQDNSKNHLVIVL